MVRQRERAVEAAEREAALAQEQAEEEAKRRMREVMITRTRTYKSLIRQSAANLIRQELLRQFQHCFNIYFHIETSALFFPESVFVCARIAYSIVLSIL
jgi:hypothetical protein